MQIFEYDGDYVPSRVLEAVRTSGLDVLGVTATEAEDGSVAAIQIILEAETPEADVASVVTAVGTGPDLEALTAQIKTRRDALLVGCDWTQLPDAPLTPDEKAAWAAYRQNLRDLTSQDGFDPSDPVWPDAPTT